MISTIIKQYDEEQIFSCISTINAEWSDADAYVFSETVNDFTIRVSHPIQLNSYVKVKADRLEYGNGYLQETQCK